MNAIELLRNRRAAITASLVAQAAELEGIDLAQPVAPGTSPIGLTMWHVPRTQDWLVNTCLRGVEEVADRFDDGLPDPDRFGFGTGLSPEEAHEAAGTVRVPSLLAYVSAVGDEIDAWLASLREVDLDVVPPFLARQAARPAYLKPAALEEVDGLDGLTVGVLLLRPGLAHLLRHLGEVDVLATIARGGR